MSQKCPAAVQTEHFNECIFQFSHAALSDDQPWRSRSWWAHLWSLVDSTGTASSISSVHRGNTWFSSPAGRAAGDWLCAALCTATSFWICGGFKPKPGRMPNHPSASFLAPDKNLQSISADLNLHSCSSWPSQVGKKLLQLVSQNLVEESSLN